MSVILFLLVLFVLILVHEWGHYIVAKKTGMRVDEFAIGFPPRLFAIKRGETDFTFNLLPIGGFVRIFGENPQTAQDTLDEPRSFAARPRWAQALVLIAGVTMNVIFAWFLFAATFMMGVPTSVDESQAGPETKLYISSVVSGSPLANQIEPGSVVVGLRTDDASLEKLTPSAFSEFIFANGEEEITLTYTTGGEEKEVAITPIKGLLEDTDKFAIGVALSLVENVKQSFGQSLVSATKATFSGLKNITVGLFTLLGQTFKGTADLSQVAGPIGIVGLVGDAASYGVTALLTFTAMISLNLAVINMLPVPALDGGRLIFVAIEAIIRRPINPIWTVRLNLLGFALLMLLMIVVTWSDVAKLL